MVERIYMEVVAGEFQYDLPMQSNFTKTRQQ
jgi:hypothetical protein